MRRLLPFLLFWLTTAAWAQEKSYLGIFMSGHRIGYTVGQVHDDTQHGATKRSDSTTVMAAGLLGSDVNVEITTRTWTNASARPVRMEYRVSSAGRAQSTVANFSDESIQLRVDNNGETSERTLKLPTDGRVVDDAVGALLGEGVAAGSSRIYYVLDPMTATLVRNEAKILGKTNVSVKGQSFAATEVAIIEPRATMRVFLSGKGDLIKVHGPMGMEMWPITAEEAEAPFGERPGNVDLAFGTKLKPDRTIGNPAEFRRLRLRLRGDIDLSRLPSDTHQSLKKESSSWVMEIHPGPIRQDTLVEDASKRNANFLAPSLNVPSDDPEIAKLAKTVVGDAETVAQAAERIREHVYRIMRPNAGIGVLRDAREVLKSKEGVCRDYSILAAALLRASGIPTRVVSGLVWQDDAFYYHAWVEVWDGTKWSGVDPTRNEFVGVGHLKLAHGNVEEAFTFTLLEGVTIEVVYATPR